MKHIFDCKTLKYITGSQNSREAIFLSESKIKALEKKLAELDDRVKKLEHHHHETEKGKVTTPPE